MNFKILNLLTLSVAAQEKEAYDWKYNKLALEGHNHYRRQHQVADLVPSKTAAMTAQAYAEKLHKEDLWEHSKPAERNGCGENLAMHSNTELLRTTNIATKMWYDEIDNPGYDFSNPGYYENPGTGHMTAILWKDTTEIGCGISGPFVVCHYCNNTPNMLGKFEENVLPKVAGGAPDSNNDLSFLEILEQCSSRQFVNKDNQCENCPTYHRPSDDRKSCVIPECPPDQVVCTKGFCAKCADGMVPSDDQRYCYKAQVLDDTTEEEYEEEEEDNNGPDVPIGEVSYPEMAMQVMLESTSELKTNLETISEIVSSTMTDQQIWRLLTDSNPKLAKIQKGIRRVGLGFTKAMYRVKKLADHLQKGMTRQDKIDTQRDKIDSRGKLTVEKDIKMFFRMLKNKLKLMNGQTKQLKGISKQLKRLLPWADKISMRAAKKLKQDQDKSFQLILEVLDDFCTECEHQMVNIDDVNIKFDDFIARFDINVNEDNFGSEEQRDALYDKYDEITDQLSAYAKQIGEEAMNAKQEFESMIAA